MVEAAPFILSTVLSLGIGPGLLVSGPLTLPLMPTAAASTLTRRQTTVEASQS
ncbi:hypothetical protein ACIBI9_40960 [Nonomuraea sp. NPDC050451]|uniref:hypothetical protein n=1 Tax=Nonomuraea sp. NPDC050451 TaxID=3364364 RepID=UPI0037ACB9BE